MAASRSKSREPNDQPRVEVLRIQSAGRQYLLLDVVKLAHKCWTWAKRRLTLFNPAKEASAKGPKPDIFEISAYIYVCFSMSTYTHKHCCLSLLAQAF